MYIAEPQLLGQPTEIFAYIIFIPTVIIYAVEQGKQNCVHNLKKKNNIHKI